MIASDADYSARPQTGKLEERFSYNPQEKRSGTADASINDALLHRGDRDEICDGIHSGETIHLLTRIAIRSPVHMPELGIILRSQNGQILSGSSNRILHRHTQAMGIGEICIDWSFKIGFLGGNYYIDLGIADLADGERKLLDLRQSCLHLAVLHESETFGIVDADFDLDANF